MSTIDNIDETLNAQRAIVKKLLGSVTKLASDLTASRVQVIPKFASDIEDILHSLGMPDAKLSVELKTDKGKFTHLGSDEVEILFSANKGMKFASIKKVASGGELSRIMLAIKAITARYVFMPTIMFDEIDTGVSGNIADKMAQIMKEMSKHRQVFAITHVPQVAAKADEHYKVYKQTISDKTVTLLERLGYEERINEIAQMIDGNEVTATARRHAESLIKGL